MTTTDTVPASAVISDLIDAAQDQALAIERAVHGGRDCQTDPRCAEARRRLSEARRAVEALVYQ